MIKQSQSDQRFYCNDQENWKMKLDVIYATMILLDI